MDDGATIPQHGRILETTSNPEEYTQREQEGRSSGQIAHYEYFLKHTKEGILHTI